MASSESDNDTFLSASGVSLPCPILQSIKKRQDSGSTTSVTSLALKRELEGKQRKLNHAELKHKAALDLYNQWKMELQVDEDRIMQRKAEIDEEKEMLKEQIISGQSEVSRLEEGKLILAAEIAQNAKKLEDVELELQKKKAVIQTVRQKFGTVTSIMQELSLGLASEVGNAEEGENGPLQD